MFGFGKADPIPTDQESLNQRGAWLAIAFLKASGGDLQLLMKTLGLTTLPKDVQSKARLEMAIFSLSKSGEILEPLIREELVKSRTTPVEQVIKDFLDGAWRIVKDLFPREESNIRIAQETYQGDDDKTSTLWNRLRDLGVDVDINKMKLDLSIFERTVLQGTVITLTLDAVTVPQTQIQHDHNSLFRRTAE